MSARIRHLPSTTQAKLRSTQILTSLPQVVSELVQNSLDAGAKRIELGVDCEEWSCWVRDDGCGMSKSELTSLIDTGRYSESLYFICTVPLTKLLQVHPRPIHPHHWKKLIHLDFVVKVRVYLIAGQLLS